MIANFEQIRYEKPSVRVARITLARPDTRNAQDLKMIYEIDQALDHAMQDDSTRVVIVAADGEHFSSGHHLGDYSIMEGYGAPINVAGPKPGPEGYMAREQRVYFDMSKRWRDLPKPTIAQVQGKALAGGLMLAWSFDLIIASDDAEFSDPVVAFGVNGFEYFVHTWEVGHRKAKEMLFTGDVITATEGKALGMVNQVVPRAQLASYTLQMAEKIGQRPSFGLKLAKMSVNQSLDAQGMASALQAAFAMHHLGHAHNVIVNQQIVDITGVDVIRKQAQATKRST
jgi:enoyl-CoA hydratase